MNPNLMTNTHILINKFDYAEPTSLEEAISLLAEYGEQAQLLAGGTNLLVWMKMEQRMPRHVIYIGHLPDLDGLAFGEDGLTLGPLVTIRTLRDDPAVRATYTALSDACAAFGSTQVQMMGTLGGNLCNGSPASDTVPALLAFDAQVTLTGPDGERTLPLADFLVGPGKVALRRGELLTAITLPAPAANTGSAFIKIGRVSADLAKASVAATVVRDGDRVTDCRLAYGSVGPTVLRVRAAEQAVIGKPLTAEVALEAGRIASEAISPIDDVRSTAWYRRQVVKALTHDALMAAYRRAEASGEKPTVPHPPSPPRRADKAAHRGGINVSADAHRTITLTVNGQTHHLDVRPNELLLNLLRERLGLTGAKYSCGIGECGACTVLMDGKPVLACLVLAITADGADILTVEGLQAPDGELHPLQKAFIEQNAFQCGFCTPGMLMITKSLLDTIPTPSEAEIRDYIKGNRCRCTGYASIVRAVERAVKSVSR